MPKGRILAVDDQRYFRELLESLLVEDGYEVVTASSGDEALRILEHSRFDVLLTDLVMPGMDGNDLVHRAKTRDPEQEIVVVTGVVDVKTAVDAMKLGASEYLLKPFDRVTLSKALDKILQSRRLKAEHARLLAENIEYMGERTLFERAAAMFSCLAVDPLAARIVEGLCIETRAQGGSIWIADGLRPDRLNLAAVRGLVRVNEEPVVVKLDEIPAALVRDARASLVLPQTDASGEARPVLYFALRREEDLVGLVRLTDKLGHDEFDADDQVCGEKFVAYGEIALANALRFARLEKRTLADPSTGAYSVDYFQGVVRSEIEKANRFGRTFSLLKLDCGRREPAGDGGAERRPNARLTGMVAKLNDVIRAADVLATDGDGRFLVLLPETDALGGAVFRERVAQALDPLAPAAGEVAAGPVELAVVSYPADGTQLEALLRVLDARLAQFRTSPVRSLGLARGSLAEGLAALLEAGETERLEVARSIVHFVLAEIVRRPQDRGLLFLNPAATLWPAAAEPLALLARQPTGTAVCVISDRNPPRSAGPGMEWLRPPAGVSLPPFLVRYADRAVYALVCGEKESADGIRLYHTSDRSIVEYLTFRLQRELELPELT